MFLRSHVPSWFAYKPKGFNKQVQSSTGFELQDENQFSIAKMIHRHGKRFRSARKLEAMRAGSKGQLWQQLRRSGRFKGPTSPTSEETSASPST